MKKKKRNKKAAASANATAGTRLDTAWIEKSDAELLKLINAAGS